MNGEHSKTEAVSSNQSGCTGGHGCCNPHGDCPQCGCAGKIKRLTRELEVQKAVVDLAYIPHRNLVESRDHVIAERDRLRSALRKALNVWHNYRIDSTEDERAIEAECRALVDDHSDSIDWSNP